MVHRRLNTDRQKDDLKREVERSGQAMVEKSRVHGELKRDHQKTTSNAKSTTVANEWLGKSELTGGLNRPPKHYLKREVKHSGQTIVEKIKVHRRLKHDHQKMTSKARSTTVVKQWLRESGSTGGLTMITKSTTSNARSHTGVKNMFGRITVHMGS